MIVKEPKQFYIIVAEEFVQTFKAQTRKIVVALKTKKE